MNAIMFTIGLISGGVAPYPADLSIKFSASIFSIINTFGMTSGFISPYLIGYILDLDPTNLEKQWSIVWFVTAAVRIIDGLVFLCIGEAKRQKWDRSDEIESNEIVL